MVGKKLDCRIENKEVVAVKRYHARAGDKRACIQCPAIVAIEIHIIERKAIEDVVAVKRYRALRVTAKVVRVIVLAEDPCCFC